MLTFTVSALRIKAIKPDLNVVCRAVIQCVRLRLFWVHWAWLQAPHIAPLAASRNHVCRRSALACAASSLFNPQGAGSDTIREPFKVTSPTQHASR